MRFITFINIMKKAGRPSRKPKKLKNGFYMSISISNTSRSIRIMRESFDHEFKNMIYIYFIYIILILSILSKC